MKKKRIHVIGLFIFLFFISNPVNSQLECKVLMPALSGEYDGGCKKGLAHGKGIAKGVDRYDGRFVKGYPHGSGRYDWSTGEYYEGDWRKGLRDGKGRYYFFYNQKDNVFAGLWKKDKYIGPDYGQPKVGQKLNVSRVDFVKVGDGQKAEVTVYQGGNPVGELYDFTIVANSGSEYEVGKSVGFNNILFPFTCRITFTILNAFRTESINCIVEVEINEPGIWQIKIHSL